MTSPIAIDVWSDIACPWCYIGKRNLERGIEAAAAATGERPDVTVTYRSFELAPDTPDDFEGSSLDYLVRVKGIDRQTAAAMQEHVARIAAEAGLIYDFDAVRQTRTLRAHQLVHLAKREGCQLEMVERLMRAYFCEGRRVGRLDELAALGSEVGLDPDTIRDALVRDALLGDVRADQAQAAAYGITAVPFFVVDGRYGVAGAQPPQVIARVLAQVGALSRTDTAAE